MAGSEQVNHLLKDAHSGCNFSDWFKVHPNLVFLCYSISKWAQARKLPMRWTSIIRPMIPGVSKTNIHLMGRAADFSVKGWTTDDINDCAHEFSKCDFKKIGAVSVSDGQQRAIVFHTGTAMHGHAQVKG